jgi:hypothetical protein
MVLVMVLIVIINRIINKLLEVMEQNMVMYLQFMVVIMGTNNFIINLVNLHTDLWINIIDIMNQSYYLMNSMMHKDYKL